MNWEIIHTEAAALAASGCTCSCTCGECNCATTSSIVGAAGRQGGYAAGNAGHNNILDKQVMPLM